MIKIETIVGAGITKARAPYAAFPHNSSEIISGIKYKPTHAARIVAGD